MAELRCIYGADKDQGLVLIFVHGLGGDLYKTWMHDPKDDTTFWPRWVAEDCDCATWTLGYDASLSAWRGNAMPLPTQGDSVLDRIDSEPKLKNRPLLFIGHSLGGLLIKTVMISGLTKGVTSYHELVERIRGVVFIATPHNGSELANLAQAVKFALHTNEQVGDLTLHNAHLSSLHQQFLAHYNKSPFPVRTFAERYPVPLGKNFFRRIIRKVIVDPDSAEPHVPGKIATPLSEDHFSICKPESREAQIHISLMAFIHDEVNPTLENKFPPQESENKSGFQRSNKITGETTMKSNLELMQDKLESLERELILATDAEVKFQLEHRITKLQQDIEKKR